MRSQRQGSRFVDLLDTGSQVKPHYGGRGHDGGDLAFLFLNVSGDLVLLLRRLNDCRWGREVDFRP